MLNALSTSIFTAKFLPSRQEFREDISEETNQSKRKDPQTLTFKGLPMK